MVEALDVAKYSSSEDDVDGDVLQPIDIATLEKLSEAASWEEIVAEKRKTHYSSPFGWVRRPETSFYPGQHRTGRLALHGEVSGQVIPPYLESQEFGIFYSKAVEFAATIASPYDDQTFRRYLAGSLNNHIANAWHQGRAPHERVLTPAETNARTRAMFPNNPTVYYPLECDITALVPNLDGYGEVDAEIATGYENTLVVNPQKLREKLIKKIESFHKLQALTGGLLDKARYVIAVANNAPDVITIDDPRIEIVHLPYSSNEFNLLIEWLSRVYRRDGVTLEEIALQYTIPYQTVEITEDVSIRALDTAYYRRIAADKLRHKDLS